MILYRAESNALFSIQDAHAAEHLSQGCDEVDPSRVPAGHVFAVGLKRSTVIASIDFETYSEAGYIIDHATGKVTSASKGKQGGLPLVGTPNYACHPSAEVLSAYYDLKDGKGRRFWMPGMSTPQDLIDHISNGGLIEAWNFTFEWWIWNMVCVKKYGWVPLPLNQGRCVMARSRRYSLPGALGVASMALGTPGKDKDGGALIRKLTRPQSKTKTRDTFRHTYANAWPDFLKFFKYNEQDVEAEDGAAALIPDLDPDELAAWQHDQRINARGVQVDIEALDAALFLQGEADRLFTVELVNLTGGAVNGVNETAKMREFLAAHGLDLPDIQAETVEAALKLDNLAPLCRRVLEIRQALAGANIKKLKTLKLQVSGDGRLRDQYKYCGADRTGRASAGGVQMQNLTAKGPKSKTCKDCGRIVGKDFKLETVFGPDACHVCGSTHWEANNDWTIEAVEDCLSDILRRDLVYFMQVWGDPITALCGCLRGLFIATKGHDLICCDYSAIEAVVAACLAREQWRIDVFNSHAKIYEQSAANATGIQFEAILQYKKDNGMHHPARKGVGKIRELAGGYGGWIGAWKNFGADDYFNNDDEIKADVLKWRDESPAIVEMWGGQYRWCGPGKWDYRPELFGLEGCAILAIQNPGKCYHHIDITYGVFDDVLYCRLPSGRFLHYHRPRLTNEVDKLNRGPSLKITFEGYNSNSVKGPIGWVRMETYGGRLFENAVQAVAADIQFKGLQRVEAAGYPIVMHTHDEGSAEVPEGFGSVDEMAALMCEREPWFAWWPIRAAGWRHKRYQKD